METEPQAVPGVLAIHVDCRSIVLAWERLRLVYNAIMLVFGLSACLVFASSLLTVAPIQTLMEVAVFGVLANICFCLGPYAEIVIALFISEQTARRARPVMFAVGLLISLGLIGVACLMQWALQVSLGGGGFST